MYCVKKYSFWRVYEQHLPSNISSTVFSSEEPSHLLLLTTLLVRVGSIFYLHLLFNGFFASGARIHPWIATGRAWTGVSEARIGHIPIHIN